MRNDVKIGIAVGVFVIVIGLVWFVFFSDKSDGEGGVGERKDTVPGFEIAPEPGPGAVAVTPPADRPPAPEDSAAPTTPAQVGPGPGPMPAVAPIDSGPAERPRVVVGEFTAPDDGARPAPSPSPLVALTEPPVTGRPPASLPRHDPYAGPALEPTSTSTDVRRPLPYRVFDEPTDLAEPPGGRVGEAVEPGPGATSATAPVGRRRVYVVTEQDTGGFWDIAEKEYGSGTHWELIRDANPDADTNNLRPGQELVIPPLPASGPRETTRQDLPTGAPTGSDTYVVKDGDSYWKIAQALYGRGDYFYLLEQANGIDAGSLRPGMVLVVPPKPQAPRPAASTDTAGEPPAGERITAGPGEKIYTVVEGDSYWRIAKEQYGEGHLWPAIRDANPDVDPQTMRPGMRLLIPSIEVARRAVGGTPSRATETGRASTQPQPGRPIFD